MLTTIMYLEQVRWGRFRAATTGSTCGTKIWGYAPGGPPQGHIKDACQSSGRRPRLSERGLLYSPGELLR